MAVPIDADTNAKIDIDPAVDTTVGIIVPIYTDANYRGNLETVAMGWLIEGARWW
jgi:hypothetical protein